MYNDRLTKEKLTLANTNVTLGLELDKKDIFKIIDSFCTKDAVIGVPTNKVFELFDEFCDESGIKRISHLTLGKLFREHFGLDRKKVRSGKNLFWVYVPCRKERDAVMNFIDKIKKYEEI